jgi:hypothetical protein
MKCLFLLPVLLICADPPSRSLSPAFIDPTGTYLLKGVVKRNNIVGHFGEIRVRLLDPRTIAFCLYINNGYPQYASAAILDTLAYADDIMHYRPGNDSTCSLVLSFHERTVELMEVFLDPHSGCGFAPGVLAPAIFDKTSSDIPVIQDLSQRRLPG